MNRRNFISNALVSIGGLFVLPVLDGSIKKSLYKVEATSLHSPFYKSISFTYYGEKQVKIGDIITTIYDGSNIKIKHTFKVVKQEEVQSL